MTVIAGITDSRDTATSLPLGVFSYSDGDPVPHELTRLPLRQHVADINALRTPPALFEPQPLWAISSNGAIVYTGGDSMLVKGFDIAGSFVFETRINTPARAVSDAEFEREFSRRMAHAPAGPMGTSMRESATRRVPLHAAITAIRTLENGNVWLRRSPTETGDSVAWIVLSQSGSPTGRVMLKVDARVLASHDDLMLVDFGAGTDVERFVWSRMIPMPTHTATPTRP